MQGIFALILLLPMLGNSVHVENEYCRPRPTLVAIDKPNYKFFPYFINLHRCGGSCKKIQPSVRSCVPTQYTEVPVTVQVVGTKQWIEISMRNHTSCGCECTLSPSQCDPIWENWKPDLCQCRCKYGDKPPKPCGNGLVWSKNDCRCVCNKEPEICPLNKVWSSEKCGCVCTEERIRNCTKMKNSVDEETCMCTSTISEPETGKVSSTKPTQKGGFPQEFYIALFLGQFVLMYLVFDAILYRKKAGLIYRLTRSCSTDKVTITGSRSNIEDSREDIFSQSSSVVVMTDLPTQTGERNMAAISDV